MSCKMRVIIESKLEFVDHLTDSGLLARISQMFDVLYKFNLIIYCQNQFLHTYIDCFVLLYEYIRV